MSSNAWRPFAHREFRGIWACMLAVHMANWTQQVGAASLMTSLTPSPAMAALVQSAATLPGLVFGLLGGALADLLDRRRWLIATMLGIMAVALAAGVTVFAEAITPASLLVFTALMGVGFSLQAPAAQAVTGETVPRPMMREAMALGGVAFNVSRIGGPALAGALVALGGGTALYAVVVACSTGVVVYLYTVRGRSERHGKAPPERLWSALRTGVRFVRHSPDCRLQMRIALVCLFCGSSTWALLPVVARDLYQMGPGGYGMLVGALGLGGVLGIWVLSELRRRWRPNTVVAIALTAFATITALVAARVPVWLVLPALVVGGTVWMSCLTSIWAEFQAVLPDWVRARAISIYNMVYMFAMGVGAAVWGYVATHADTPVALYVSAATMVAGALWARRQRDVTPLAEAPAKAAAFSGDNSPATVYGDLTLDDEPVLVQQSYRVQPDRADEFMAVAAQVGRSCQRNGAEFWRLYRDLKEPDTYVERFMVDSWAELQRQHERETPLDRELRERMLALLQPGTEPVVRYLAGLSLPPG